MSDETRKRLRKLADKCEQRGNGWRTRFENPEVLVNARHLADLCDKLAADIRELTTGPVTR